MQDHHGARLKERVDRSSLLIAEISQRSGIAVSSLYDMFKKPELLRSKVAPILKVLKVHPDDFFSAEPEIRELNDDGGDSHKGDQLSEIITLMKKQVELTEQMLSLSKKKK